MRTEKKHTLYHYIYIVIIILRANRAVGGADVVLPHLSRAPIMFPLITRRRYALHFNLFQFSNCSLSRDVFWKKKGYNRTDERQNCLVLASNFEVVMALILFFSNGIMVHRNHLLSVIR